MPLHAKPIYPSRATDELEQAVVSVEMGGANEPAVKPQRSFREELKLSRLATATMPPNASLTIP